MHKAELLCAWQFVDTCRIILLAGVIRQQPGRQKQEHSSQYRKDKHIQCCGRKRYAQPDRAHMWSIIVFPSGVVYITDHTECCVGPVDRM